MEIVKVRLRKPARVLQFTCSDLTLQRGDPCVVRTDRGLEFGICIIPPEPCADQMAERITMSAVRKMNSNDDITMRQLEIDEARAQDIFVKKVAAHKLPMKVADVEYSHDRRKIIFYFTAEDRVDFRELVRDLARDLRARIELRHIQVRDQAKMVGGLAACGRQLCCTTWLPEFYPISMKMAKRQNLSLNPQKISGQCGRLMCCLAYENEQYDDPKKKKSCAACQGAPAAGEEPVECVEPALAGETDFDAEVEYEEEGVREPGKVVVLAELDDAAGGSITEFTEEEGDDTLPSDALPNTDSSGKPRKRKRKRKRKPGFAPPQGPGTGA